MIKKITIENFRSIEHAEVEMAPLVVLYGPTASGKSSLLYALLVLKNFIVNPNRPADGYFHLGFMDLGGFDQCVFNHEGSRPVSVGITFEEREGQFASYKLSFSKDKGAIYQTWMDLILRCEIPIPYGLNQTFTFESQFSHGEYTINWNGITCSSVSPKSPTPSTQQKAREMAESINAVPEKIKAIDVVPQRRGFFKPNYTSVPVSPTPTTEDEVASLIINDPDLAPRISVYTEAIFERDFRLYVPPGTATVFFQTTDKKSITPGLLVNDGFGVNQVIYLLAKLLRSDVRTLLIEEPEVHLHPTALRNFARQLCTITREEKKQIVLTTHSELFVSSLLAVVAEGQLSPEEIHCYLCVKEKRQTYLKAQRVHRNGQIEGGLATFIEAELEDLQKLLGIGAQRR
jgi:energy-coupling factor transporter ATP-binding protein EcfA2